MTAAALQVDGLDDERSLAGDMPDIVFVAVLGLLAIVGFSTVYGVWSWLIAGGAGLGAGIALGVFGRLRRLDSLVIAGAIALLYFALSGVAISQDAIGGVAPSPATLRGAASGAIRAWAELLTAAPPVGRLGNLGVVPLMCGLMAGVLSTSWALRTRGLVRPLLPLLAVVVISILFGTTKPASLVLQGAAFGAVAIAWVAYRRRGTSGDASSTVGTSRLVGGILMVTLAAVIATVGGSHLPGAGAHERFVLRDRSDPPFDPRQHSSPLASFAHYKSDEQATGGVREDTLFTVEGLPDGVPLRIAVMDTYDGVVWTVAGGSDGSRSPSGEFARVGETVPQSADADLPEATGTARLQITVDGYNDIWLPYIGSVTGIQFGGPRSAELTESLRFNRTTNVGAVPVRFRSGDRIVIDAEWSKPPVQGAAEQPFAGKVAGVAATGAVERAAEGLTELAERLLSGPPPGQSAGDDTDAQASAEEPGAGTAVKPGFDSVYRIAESFVVNGAYGYSDGRAGDPAPNVSGHSKRRMDQFANEALKVGSVWGNDEQYASALALISRELNMPSRVVMGFCRTGCDGGTVTGGDVSAWVEVNVDGVGWVPLNATPREDKEVEQQVPPSPKPTPQNASQPPPPPVTVPPPEEIIAESVSAKKDKKESGDSIFASIPWRTIATVAAPFAVVGGFVGTVLTLKRRRRTRRRDEGDELSRIVGGWDELDDLALDLGRPLPTRSTRLEIANYLGTDAAHHSVRIADAAIWGTATPSESEIEDYWMSIDVAYQELTEGTGPLSRARAALNPASLIRSSRNEMGPKVRETVVDLVSRVARRRRSSEVPTLSGPGDGESRERSGDEVSA